MSYTASRPGALSTQSVGKGFRHKDCHPTCIRNVFWIARVGHQLQLVSLVQVCAFTTPALR